MYKKKKKKKEPDLLETHIIQILLFFSLWFSFILHADHILPHTTPSWSFPEW